MSILTGYDEIKQYFFPIKYHPYINLYDLNAKIIFQKILDRPDLKFSLLFYQKLLGYYFHNNYGCITGNISPYEIIRGANQRINNKTFLLDYILLSDDIDFCDFVICILTISTAPGSGHTQTTVNIVESNDHIFVYAKIYDSDVKPNLILIDLCNLKEICFSRNVYSYETIAADRFTKIKNIEDINEAAKLIGKDYCIIPTDIFENEMSLKEDYKKVFFVIYMLINRLREVFPKIEKYEISAVQPEQDSSIWSNFDLVKVRQD